MCSGVLTDTNPTFPDVFAKLTLRWPPTVAQIMPSESVDQSLRQLLGPPYIIYTCKSAFESCACLETSLAAVAAVAAVAGGCFARPDNNWAGTHQCIRWAVSVKKVHGIAMCVSFLCNVVVSHCHDNHGGSLRPWAFHTEAL